MHCTKLLHVTAAACRCNTQNLKFAVRADTLPDGSTIPAGCQVLYSPYVVNRSKSFWGPDAVEFRWGAACCLDHKYMAHWHSAAACRQGLHASYCCLCTLCKLNEFAQRAD